MWLVILLTIVAGWCVLSIAVALVIGAVIERRDAEDGQHPESQLPTLSEPITATAPSSVPAVRAARV